MAQDRVQFDMQNLPAGVMDSLRKMAASTGLSVGLYCKTVLIQHALAGGANRAPTGGNKK